jgi:hypothetical protein
VRHRTDTVDGLVPISFLFWRRRPLQICGSWRTGHCPVHTKTVWCPLPTVGAGHTSPTDCAADRCAGGHWLTGQSGAPPDSPMNYSHTPPIFPRVACSPEAGLAHRTLSGAPSRAGLWLYQAKSFAFLFFSSFLCF